MVSEEVCTEVMCTAAGASGHWAGVAAPAKIAQEEVFLLRFLLLKVCSVIFLHLQLLPYFSDFVRLK